MKFARILILFVALLSLVTTAVAAEDTAVTVQSVESLRLQLLEVEAKDAELQARARQLDEDLKSENIERAFAGIGSTRPEELRESRRRQLTIERESVRVQLKLVATSRERLEAVIRTADSQAYQQSAEGVAPPLDQVFAAQNANGPALRVLMLVGLIAIVGMILGAGIARRAYVFARYSCQKRFVMERRGHYAR